VIEVCDITDYRDFTDKIEIKAGNRILIIPGETVPGVTRERLRLGPRI
jgi:dCTP deaminase